MFGRHYYKAVQCMDNGNDARGVGDESEETVCEHLLRYFPMPGVFVSYPAYATKTGRRDLGASVFPMQLLEFTDGDV